MMPLFRHSPWFSDFTTLILFTLFVVVLYFIVIVLLFYRWCCRCCVLFLRFSAARIFVLLPPHVPLHYLFYCPRAYICWWSFTSLLPLRYYVYVVRYRSVHSRYDYVRYDCRIRPVVDVVLPCCGGCFPLIHFPPSAVTYHVTISIVHSLHFVCSDARLLHSDCTHFIYSVYTTFLLFVTVHSFAFLRLLFVLFIPDCCCVICPLPVILTITMTRWYSIPCCIPTFISCRYYRHIYYFYSHIVDAILFIFNWPYWLFADWYVRDGILHSSVVDHFHPTVPAISDDVLCFSTIHLFPVDLRW